LVETQRGQQRGQPGAGRHPRQAFRNHHPADHDSNISSTPDNLGLDAAVSTRLPAQDLYRAKRFFAEKLGLQPAETRPGACVTSAEVGASLSSCRPAGEHTQVSWQVDDIDAATAQLRRPRT
jgi:hypothetical protein